MAICCSVIKAACVSFKIKQSVGELLSAGNLYMGVINIRQVVIILSEFT